MKPEGWIFLGISWIGIIGLCVFCFSVMFRTRRQG